MQWGLGEPDRSHGLEKQRRQGRASLEVGMSVLNPRTMRTPPPGWCDVVCAGEQKDSHNQVIYPMTAHHDTQEVTFNLGHLLCRDCILSWIEICLFFFFFLLFSRKKIKGKSQKSHGTNMSLEIRISGFCFQFQSFLLWKCNSWNGWTSSEFISAKGENKYNHLSQHTHIHTHTHPILNMQIVGSMIPSFQNTDFGNESALDCPASLLHFGAISQLMLC